MKHAVMNPCVLAFIVFTRDPMCEVVCKVLEFTYEADHLFVLIFNVALRDSFAMEVANVYLKHIRKSICMGGLRKGRWNDEP